jgi:hypothetical protein
MLTIIESADDPIDQNVRTSNELRPWVLVPNNRQIGLRNLHIISAASPMQRIHELVTLRIPNPLREKISVDLVISHPAFERGGTVHLLLPTAERLQMESIRLALVQLTQRQRALATQHKFNPTKALQVAAQRAVIHGLKIEPGETITAGLVLDSGAKAIPGTATRVTVLARYGDTVLGGSTYVLRIPAKLQVRRVITTVRK